MQKAVLGGRYLPRCHNLRFRKTHPRAKATKDEEQIQESQQTGEPQGSRKPVEENPREAAKIRKVESTDKGGLNIVQGVLEEVRLISWPTPVQAVTDTISVVALVALLAVTLFALNTGLNEASKVYYNFAKEFLTQQAKK